jgi:hypothetical protein
VLRSPVSRFTLAVVLWLPLCFGAWYYLAIVITWPLTDLVHWLMTSLLPEAIAEVGQQGYLLEVVTRFPPPPQPGMPELPAGELAFDLNPLIYGYSLPLYTALTLATPDPENRNWWRWFFGLALLFPLQAWGIGFDILKTLAFDLGPEIRGRLDLAPWALEATALGYQFGTLVLPAVAPVALWLGQHRIFVASLAPGMAERFATPRRRD